MTNYDKYKIELLAMSDAEKCDFIRGEVLDVEECSKLSCGVCRAKFIKWLKAEHEEPAIDWSKVEVDTPILVRESEDESWKHRHFAEYKNDKVYVWMYGTTSFTTTIEPETWPYAKLAEVENG